jgi:hypothetical protein
MKEAIEKHQSRSKSSEIGTDKVLEDEIFLDHLVKLTTGAYSILVYLTFPIEN